MARTHRTRDGAWATCHAGEDCPSPIHVDLSPEAAAQLPEIFIETLARAFDPPTRAAHGGTDWWHDADGRTHRDWGLPAIIRTDGSMRAWMHHGLQHRDHGLPAEVWSNGYAEWWQNGIALGRNEVPHPLGASAAITRIYVAPVPEEEP